MIYLASPFMHPDVEVRRQRYEAVCRAAAALTCAGKTVFAPVILSYAICDYGAPLDWRFWERHHRVFLEACDEVIVLMLHGWRESSALHAEISLAKEFRKAVSYLSPAGETGEIHDAARTGDVDFRPT